MIGAVRELGFDDLDVEAFTADVSEIDAPSSGETHYIDPTPVDGWRDSESGESVMVFDSGVIDDADTETTIDPLRLVALDSGLIDAPTDSLAGQAFQEAYRRAREDYGAPLPRWTVGTPDVTPVLPPAEELVNAVEPDGDLEDAREDVETLYRKLARGEGDAPVSVLRALPSLGKTTSAIKTAADIPTTYLAPGRNCSNRPPGRPAAGGRVGNTVQCSAAAASTTSLFARGVEIVRDRGKHLLRDYWSLLDLVDEPVFTEDDEESVDIDRPTCPCAEGEQACLSGISVTPAFEHPIGMLVTSFRAEAQGFHRGGSATPNPWRSDS